MVLTERDDTIADTKYRISLTPPVGGDVTGGLGPHLRVLQSGAFVAAGVSGVVTVTIPAHVSAPGQVFTYLSGIRGEDVVFTSGQKELSCGISAQPIDNSGNPIGTATTLPFRIRKPPVVLVHGFHSAGNWGDNFKAGLYTTRPNEFVFELHYGIDPVSGDLQENTTGDFIPLAGVLDRQLKMDVEGEGTTPGRWESDWALTRYDVVAHSQGGILTRMLSTLFQPWDANIGAFRSRDNFYRGRFRRVVTIGAPQNGSSFLHYLRLMDANRVGYLRYGFVRGLLRDFLQPKFDPWDEQVAQINRAGCSTDPAAKFHALRAQVRGFPWAFRLVGLGEKNNSPGSNLGKTGQEIVFPNGSDTIVDMDSQRGNPGTPGSLFPEEDIAHAARSLGGVDIFGTPNDETTYGPLGAYVGVLLDQRYLPGDTFNFGSFLIPSPASAAWRDAINAHVQYLLQAQTDDPSLLIADPSPAPMSVTFRYAMNPIRYGLPVAGSANWFLCAFGPQGVTTDGLTLQVNTNDQTRVTIKVEDFVVGDVVLYGGYTATNGAIVYGAPVVLLSRPAGTTITGIALMPAQARLAVGDEILPLVWARYSNGTNSLIYAPPGAGPQVVSSNPAVVSVGQNGVLRAQSAGVCSITATYNGFTTNAAFVVNPELRFIETFNQPSSGGVPMGGRYYSAGTNATVTATANPGYTFVNWSEAGTVVSTTSNYTFTVTGDRTLIAQFVPNIPVLGFGSSLWQNGLLNLTLQGPIGSNYQVQASTNLYDWLTLTNFISMGSPVFFQVPAATNVNRRFYRAIMQ